MFGAIAGDIIGSVHEHLGTKRKDFPLFAAGCSFTDDTVLTVAVAEAVRTGADYGVSLRAFGRRYPDAGYGGLFLRWLLEESAPPYGSFGNGSAMRVAPIGWAFDDPDVVLREAARSAAVTHDHPEGIKGAQAVASAILLARTGSSRDAIRIHVEEAFGYGCSDDVDELRAGYTFDVTCQGTVPAAMVAFLCSTGFEDAVRNAVSLGGDADTLACIAGAIAEAYYGGVPPGIRNEALGYLDSELLGAAESFAAAFGIPA